MKPVIVDEDGIKIFVKQLRGQLPLELIEPNVQVLQ